MMRNQFIRENIAVISIFLFLSLSLLFFNKCRCFFLKKEHTKFIEAECTSVDSCMCNDFCNHHKRD